MSSQELAAVSQADILIVDDVPANLKLLAGILKDEGYQVRPASDGELALRSARARLPDLILLDILMPGMDGYEVCRQLKAAEETRDIPVIFISGKGESIDKVKAFGLGGVDYILKPFESEEVLARVRTHISIRAMQKKLVEQNLQLSKSGELLEQRVAQRTKELSESEARFRSLTHSAHDAIITIDEKSTVVSWNRAATSMFGRDEREMLGQNIDIIVPENYREARNAAMQRPGFSRKGDDDWGSTVEYEGLHKTGRIFPVELSLATWSSGDNRFYSGILRDISERKRAEHVIAHLASHDVLTDLPNRRMLMELLGQELASCDRHGHIGAALFIDLDEFKPVNDTLGHPIGDFLLIEVARRLKMVLRREDIATRIGGDEFVVLFPKIGDTHEQAIDQIRTIANKILETLSAVYYIEGHEIHVSASIGITFFPLDGGCVDDVILHADAAMYQAKEAGRNTFCFYAKP